MVQPSMIDNGGIAKGKIYELAIMDQLVGIQASRPGLVPADLDVYEKFRISYSFRKGATSSA